MRLTKEQKEQENIISDRDMRDKCVERYEVLEKVKNLLLLPGTDLMSIDQVADYYEVSSQGIKNLYSQNREEIDEDGTKILPRDFYNGSTEKVLPLKLNKHPLHIPLKMVRLLQLTTED